MGPFDGWERSTYCHVRAATLIRRSHPADPLGEIMDRRVVTHEQRRLHIRGDPAQTIEDDVRVERVQGRIDVDHQIVAERRQHPRECLACTEG
jgi:hypothetical protein